MLMYVLIRIEIVYVFATNRKGLKKHQVMNFAFDWSGPDFRSKIEISNLSFLRIILGLLFSSFFHKEI